MGIAIITGASSGLGREFVKQISEKEKVSEIWVIARREERLRELQSETSVPLKVVAIDLSVPEKRDALKSLLGEEKPDVRVLVNAAGIGKIGKYDEIGRADALNMIRLNCEAAVDVTEMTLPYMQKGARILEICSTSAFQPLQGLNIYAATKAFLLRYSRALGVELFGRGVRVTAVCPYWIKDTEFIPKAGSPGKNKGHYPFASKKKSVVSTALFFSHLSFPVCTPGIICTLHRIGSALPDTVLMLIWALLRRI